MKSDITLIFPDSPFLEISTMFPPLGIMYISSYLKYFGVDVQCLDLALGQDYQSATSDIIGISFTTPQRESAFELIRHFKREGKTVVVGGPHPTHMENECLRAGADKVFKGYAEHDLLEWITNTKITPLTMEEIPFPDRDALPIYEYKQTIDGKSDSRPSTPMISARGCPFKCLEGGTLVNTIEGKIPIRDLVGKDIKVLTYDSNEGRILFSSAINVQKTGTNVELVRVHFDDDSYIDCTPDHLFKKFVNGNQFVPVKEFEVEARFLRSKDRVRAVRYEWNPRAVKMRICWSRKGVSESRLVMEGMLGRKLSRKEVVHHKDRNTKNNFPDNLELTFQKEHIGKFHPEISERMRKNNPAKNMTEEWKENVSKGLKGIKRSEESRIRYSESKMGRKNPNYKHGKWSGHYSRISPGNHKVVWVEHLKETKDTYCMEVPGYNWFYANDVLVHNCSFCSQVDPRYIPQSANKMLSELYYLRDKYGFEAFTIYDDSFICDKQRFDDIHAQLSKEDFMFRCFSRTTGIDEDTCEKLAEMGVIAVGLGVESGSNDILKLNMKGTTRRANTNAVKNLQKVGIEAKAFLIVGLPGETEKTIKETLSWIEEARPDSIGTSVFQPLPGSSIFNNPEKYHVDFQYNGQPFVYRTKKGEYTFDVTLTGLTPEEVIHYHKVIEDFHAEYIRK